MPLPAQRPLRLRLAPRSDRCGCRCRCRCSESPLMAPRRWCRNRIKKRPLSERSEFRTLPDFGASGVGSPRSGPPSSGSPSLGYFSWRSKRSDPAAGTDTRLGRPAGQAALLHPPASGSREAVFDVAVCNGCTTQGAAAAPAGRVKRCVLTAVGTSRVSARQPTYFSCVAKRSRQEKATLRRRSASRTARAAST